MKGSTFFKAASLLSPLCRSPCAYRIPCTVLTSTVASVAIAQGTTDNFTHAATGIQFLRETIDETQTTGGYQWGFALPAVAAAPNDEYIGYLVSEPVQKLLDLMLTIVARFAAHSRQEGLVGCQPRWRHDQRPSLGCLGRRHQCQDQVCLCRVRTTQRKAIDTR
jgi:hypothetical protein